MTAVKMVDFDIEKNDPEAVLYRMKEIAGVKTNKKIAEILGVTDQYIHKWQSRGGAPARFMCNFAKQYGVDVFWLATGEGAPRHIHDINISLLTAVISGLEKYIEEQHLTIESAKKAKLIRALYSHFASGGHADDAGVIQLTTTLMTLL